MALLSSFGRGKTPQELNVVTDRAIPQPPADSVSEIAFSPGADVLAVASWDNSLRMYEVAANGECQSRALYEHKGPVLGLGWAKDGTKVVSGGADNVVRAFDLASGQAAQIGQHDAPVKCVKFVDVGAPVVASASWDKTLRYWDLRQPNPVTTVQLPERAVAMDTEKKLLVVASQERSVSVIDLTNPGVIYKNVSTTLKRQLRSVCCHSDGQGFALGSIEGRCSIHFVDDAKQSSTGFTFRCHRQPVQPSKAGMGDNIYAVNSISFHPTYGTFATGGSDGTICIWDRANKARLRYTPRMDGSIVSVSINGTGNKLAYAISYDWSQGYAMNKPSYPISVKVHPLEDADVRPKNSVRK